MSDQGYYFEYLKRTERFPQSIYHKAKHNMVSEMFLRLTPGALVLDAGCGIGNVTAKYCGLYSIVGIDEQPSSVKYCRHYCSGKYLQANLYKIPFKDNVFDLILFLDAIEHMKDSPVVLEELARVLKPEAKILICTMNYDSLSWIILQNSWHRFFGGSCKPYSREIHPTPYTEKILRLHCNKFFREVSLEKRLMGMELFYIGRK